MTNAIGENTYDVIIWKKTVKYYQQYLNECKDNSVGITFTKIKSEYNKNNVKYGNLYLR